MLSCELCREPGHIVFECNSNRSTTIDEAVNHWMNHRLNEYHWNSGKNVIKESFTEAQHIRRLSKGDFLYLLRCFIDPLNWSEFSTMYTRDQYMCFYLGYKTREYINSVEFNNLNESSKLRIQADSVYWLNRACFGQTRADEIWSIYSLGYNIQNTDVHNSQTHDCAICLRDNIERGEMSTFSCGHNFCISCCDTMLMTIIPLRCPLCRSYVNQNISI
jgi:hypothetical protein